MKLEKLPFEPPEPEYVAEQYVLKIPITDQHLKNPWELRKYAAKLLEERLGDNIQLTALKVKKPGVFNRAFMKLLNRVPQARLFLTVKF